MQTNKDSGSISVEEKLHILVQFTSLKKSIITQCDKPNLKHENVHCTRSAQIDLDRIGKYATHQKKEENHFYNVSKLSHFANSQLHNERSLMELNLCDIDFIHSAIMREGVQ
jgi:hypothetical protein